MVAIGFIFWIVNMLLIGIFKLIFMAFQKFINVIMVGLIVDSSAMSVFYNYEYIFEFTIAVSISLLALIASYQGLKIMFTYMGFSNDDDPKDIFFRSGFLCLLILGSKDLAKFIFGAYGEIAKGAFQMLNGKDLSAMMFGGFFGVLGGATMFFSVEMLLFLFLVYKMLSMLLKFAERYCISIVLIIFLPLALSTLATKPTRDIGKSYFRLLFGNLLAQFVQIISLVIAYSFGQINPFNPNDWINFFMVIGIILIIEKLDNIISAVGLSAGLTTDQLEPIRKRILDPAGNLGSYSLSGIKNAFNIFKR